MGSKALRLGRGKEGKKFQDWGGLKNIRTGVVPVFWEYFLGDPITYHENFWKK